MGWWRWRLEWWWWLQRRRWKLWWRRRIGELVTMTLHITDTDREHVEKTIRENEHRTSGEIVAVVASQSDDYIHAPVHFAAAIALGIPLLLPLLSRILPWETVPLRWIFVIQLATFIILSMLLSIPPLRYWITPRSIMRKYAGRFAAAEFLAINIHSTRGRNGVLLFVSLLEHYVEIIADIAVAAKVKDSEWQAIIDEMVPMLRQDRLTGALEYGVNRIGEILAPHFPPGKHDDNELPDHLIVLESAPSPGRKPRSPHKKK
jgi:putative membrane protein